VERRAKGLTLGKLPGGRGVRCRESRWYGFVTILKPRRVGRKPLLVREMLEKK